MSTLKFPCTAIALVVAVSACQSGGDEGSAKSVAIHAVYSDNQCRKSQAGIESIRDKDALEAWWLPLSRQQIPPRQLPQGLASIDFGQSVAFVVSMGSKPTPGYAVELYSDRAPLHGASLTIPATWQQPPTGVLLAQLTTSPCTVFLVPADRYDSVVVVDRKGSKLL